MPFKSFMLIFKKSEYEKEVKSKLASLERNLQELKMAITAMEEKKQNDPPKKPADPPIIIEKINIEKIIVDKYELNNNFGQLGIKEMKGKLNIGATYGSEFTPMLDEEEEADQGAKDESRKSKKPSNSNGPKVNIYAKKED